MKVLLDENLPHDFRHELSGHEVFTVHYLGWSGMKNGELLAQAAASGFDAMLTVDSGIPFQQYGTKLPLAVIVIKAKSNDLDDLRPFVPRLLNVLRQLRPKTVHWIP